MTYLTKKKSFSSWSSDSIGTGFKNKKENQNGCFDCKKSGHFIVDCPELQKGKSKKERYKKERYRSKLNKSLMATWNEYDEKLEFDKDEKEANLDLMATTTSNIEPK